MSFDIEMSKDGYKILRINKDDKKIYLGSKYSQKREVEKFLNSVGEINYKDNFVILGLSFGEHIKELLKLIDEDTRILIVEFDDELIEYCKSHEDTKKIIENEKVMISTNKQEIENFIIANINEINANKLKILDYCGYEKIYKQELKEIFTLMKNLVFRIAINRNTVTVFGKQFLENILSNLKYIAKSTPINRLKKAYENKPAIIVSAGPSLIRNIHEIKDLDKALILSGGRTLGALLEKEISPSCLGIIDAGEPSYKLVEMYIEKVKCPLVFNDSVNKKVVKEHKAEKFFYAQSHSISNIFNEKIQTLHGGGSIAHSLTNLAIYMGCNPIIFIGQDLAYTGERGHAICCEDTWKKRDFDQYKKSDDIYVKDINGNLVRTSIVLNDFRVSLEKIINKHPNIKFINATEGGSNIEGTENRKLRDVIRELKKEKIIPMASFFENTDKTQAMIKELECNLTLIKEYIKLCKKAKIILGDYRKSYYSKNHKEVDRSIKILNEIDRKIIEKNHEISLISTAIAKIIFEIENNNKFMVYSSDSTIIRFNKEFNRSKALYFRIETILNYCNEEIEKIINEMKGADEECKKN